MEHQLWFLDFQVLERIYRDPWDDCRLLVAIPWARFPCSFIENNHLLWCLCLKVIWFLDFAYMVASCRLFPATQNADLSLSTMCEQGQRRNVRRSVLHKRLLLKPSDLYWRKLPRSGVNLIYFISGSICYLLSCTLWALESLEGNSNSSRVNPVSLGIRSKILQRPLCEIPWTLSCESWFWTFYRSNSEAKVSLSNELESSRHQALTCSLWRE
jgi:hypothetical protein